MFGAQNDDDGERQSFTKRAVLVGAAQVVGLGVLAAKLYQLQVLDGMHYAPLAEENRINVQLLAPMRGRILDRFGTVLATNEEGFRAIITPSLAGNIREVLGRLQRIVEITPDDIERAVTRGRRQQPHLPIIVANELTFDQVAEINLLASQLPGLQVEVDPRRLYPGGAAMGHVVGYVGNVDRVGLDDDPVLRLPGARIGRTGIERGMEDRLRGRSGSIKHEVDARGRIVRTLAESEASRGDDVVLTIDTGLQRAVMARLASERRAAAVALDTVTGEVMAMASVPTHDPSDLVKGLTRRNWAQLRQADNNPMLNRAIRGQYPPGSTFKMVTALAALEAGVISLSERIECSGRTEYAGQTFRCWKRSGHGAVDFHRGLRESCDCYYYEIARRAGIDAIAAMARRLGFDQVFETGLSQQKPGVIPDQTWKVGRFGRTWLGGETLLAGIGQGYVLATPLQLAVMTARLASGASIIPQFIRPDTGTVPAIFAGLGLKPANLDAVRRAMIAVINEEGGTGSNAKLEDGRAMVAGKTGTSQVSRQSADRAQSDLEWQHRDHALFVAYVPANRPRYAISVVVEHGGGGGATAGPLIRDIVQQLLLRDPSSKAAYPDFAGAAGAASSRSGTAL